MVPSHNRVHYESGKLGSRLIQSPKEFVANLSEEIQRVPKNVLIEQNHNPKLSALGLNFTMNMTWEGLIRLSLNQSVTSRLETFRYQDFFHFF